MAWITWRQHRMALTGAVILLGAFAAVLGISGRRLQSAHSALVALNRTRCPYPIGNNTVSSRCALLWSDYNHNAYPFSNNIPLMAVILASLPVLVGVFIGAPLLAREFEAGTGKFAWTQAMGRSRWVAAKLGWLGAALAVLSAAFGALANWWLLRVNSLKTNSRWQGPQFGLTAITFTGWMLLMFAVGVFVGALIRRTVPAMAATAACEAILLWLSIEKFAALLANFSPLHMRTDLATWNLAGAGSPIGANGAAAIRGGWVVNSWIAAPHGRIVSPDALWSLKASRQLAWVTSHHLTLWVSYQTDGRFWLFQGVEGGAAVLLAALLAAATVWLVRHRAA